jgi:predicted O-methyltransferase YrrM
MGIHGHLTASELKLISNLTETDITNVLYFIETGTFLGHSVKSAAELIPNCYTIEIVPDLIKQAKENNKEHNNITYLEGDSLKILPNILTQIQNSSQNQNPIMFFIDAHMSGQGTYHNEQQLVPLLQELDIILQFVKNNAVIIIDDIRLFDKYDDWKDINQTNIQNIFSKYSINILKDFEINDRLVLRI